MTLLKLLLCIMLCLSLPVAAYAHPGKTDSQGGHTNQSTGEYHYHHGQPEHQHYDMDGDGLPDCPYDFQDKTVHSAQITKTPAQTYEMPESTEKKAISTAKITKFSKESLKISGAEYTGLYAGICMIVFALIGIIRDKSNR